MARLAAILAVVALAATPAAALAAAQPNPFLPQQEQQQAPQEAPAQEAPAPQQAPAQQSGDTSIGGGTILLVIVGLAALIAGIWVVIVRDARRATKGRMRVQTSRADPDAARRASRAAPRGRKLSAEERRRRKRGRAR